MGDGITLIGNFDSDDVRYTAARVVIRQGARAPLTTRELLVWVSLFFLAITGTPLLHLGTGVAEPGYEPVDAIRLVAWGCVALLLARDRERRPASARQVWTMLLICTAAVPLAGIAAYLAFTAAGLTVVLRLGWSVRERRAGAVLLAMAMAKLWSKLVALLLSDVILRLDTASAGLALRAGVAGSSWSGNRLFSPDGPGVTVAMGCSSFANLSLVCLCFTSLAALDGARFDRRSALALAGACGAIVLLNTLRLLLMARSLPAFEYWHNGAGAHGFAIGMSAAAVLSCSAGARWAARGR